MTRCCHNTGRALLLTAALVLFAAVSCGAFTLISPTEGQAVRESVKIQMPPNAVPDDPQSPGFICIYVGEGDNAQFVAAMARNAAKESDGKLTFYWNSKAPYHVSNAPGKLNYFKDGIYPLTVEVHDSSGNKVESATVTVNIKNKIPRGSPSPAVSLVNKLGFGRNYTYGVHTDVGIFESAAGVDLAILGGLGIAGDFQVIQSVEDVRPNGDMMLRCRIGETPYTRVYGTKKVLYQDMKFKPQLYRLIDKYGSVLQRNLFSKQAKFTIMDVVPRLPRHAVKEGDSWPDSLGVKIEGLTALSTLEGTSQLDCFEWEQGHQCAKIKSTLKGALPISFGAGKIRGTGPATAEVTAYFDYKTGRLIKREMIIDVPAQIDAASIADELETGGLGGSVSGEDATSFIDNPEETTGSGSSSKSVTPMEPMDMPMPRAAPGTRPSRATTATTDVTAAKKGKIRLDVVVNLEK